MNPYLFVYGTLKRGNTNPFALFLAKHAEWQGEAKMPGRKFDLGEYPGAYFIENHYESVVGEVFKMNNPAFVLKALDEYECIGPDYPEPHEFIRKECHILFKNKVLNCWVYLYNWPVK